MSTGIQLRVCLAISWFCCTGLSGESLQYPIEVIPLAEECGYSIQAISKDDRILATGRPINEPHIAVWERSGQLKKTLKTGVSVGTLEIVPGRPVVLGIIDGAIFEWNFADGISRIAYKFQDSRWCIECDDWFAISPDGRYAAVTGFQDYLLIHEIASQKTHQVATKGDTRDLVFSRDSKWTAPEIVDSPFGQPLNRRLR